MTKSPFIFEDGTPGQRLGRLGQGDPLLREQRLIPPGQRSGKCAAN